MTKKANNLQKVFSNAFLTAKFDRFVQILVIYVSKGQINKMSAVVQVMT